MRAGSGTDDAGAEQPQRQLIGDRRALLRGSTYGCMAFVARPRYHARNTTEESMATAPTPPDEVVPDNQPPEIEDEYKLSLESDVLDESLLEQPDDAKFTITSYGVDYTVDTLIARVNTEAFFVPQ